MLSILVNTLSNHKTTKSDCNSYINNLVDKVNKRLSWQTTVSPNTWQSKQSKPYNGIKYKYLHNKKQTAFLHVQSSRNNTLITCYNSNKYKNKTLWASGGSSGFKNSRKCSIYASQAAAKSILDRIKQMGYKYICVRLSGTGRTKSAVVRSVQQSRLQILRITECTPMVHNGCRRPRKRRI